MLPHHSRTRRTEPSARRGLCFEDNNIYYWGQYIAAVVAETLEQAKAAAKPSACEYEAEKPDMRADLGAGFTGERESSWKRGDPDKAFRSAGGRR